MVELSDSDLDRRLAIGRTAEVYALRAWPDRVLKLFNAGIGVEQVEAEHANTAIAADAGLTRVRSHGLAGLQGRNGLILDRIDGISLTRLSARNPLKLRGVARELAALHCRVHEVAAPQLPDVRDLVLHTLDSPPLSFLGSAETELARSSVRALPAGDRLLHLDFHPENVFVADQGFDVIDWQTAARGVPAADVATSVFLMREAELSPGTSAARKRLLSAFRRSFTTAYINEYHGRCGVTSGEVAKWRLATLILRLGWDIASEREQLRAGVRLELAAAGGDAP